MIGRYFPASYRSSLIMELATSPMAVSIAAGSVALSGSLRVNTATAYADPSGNVTTPTSLRTAEQHTTFGCDLDRAVEPGSDPGHDQLPAHRVTNSTTCVGRRRLRAPDRPQHLHHLSGRCARSASGVKCRDVRDPVPELLLRWWSVRLVGQVAIYRQRRRKSGHGPAIRARRRL